MRASLRQVVLIVSAMLPAPPMAAAAPSANAEELIDRFVRAWNSHDMQAFEALFAADATWVPTFDARDEGRDAIVADLRTAHEGCDARSEQAAREVAGSGCGDRPVQCGGDDEQGCGTARQNTAARREQRGRRLEDRGRSVDEAQLPVTLRMSA